MYKFESKLQDIYIDLGKIEYSYWNTSDNYYSNFSTPVCTFYMNRKLKSGYDSDLSNINYNQNFLPNDRNLLLTSRFENRSQKNMLIHMSQRGEEMNNLARNINLKMSKLK